MRLLPFFLLAVTLQAMLVACSPAPPPAAEQTVAAPAEPASAIDVLPGVTTTAQPAMVSLPPATTRSVNEWMSAVLEPNARTLWGAVSYVVTAEGDQETMPETDADWEQLRNSAIVLMEAGDALKLPGQRVAAPGNGEAIPAFQFTAAEIEQLISTDSGGWLGSIEDMQSSVLQTMQAINRRDVQRFVELSATINQACESCHAQYWYRPQDLPRTP